MSGTQISFSSDLKLPAYPPNTDQKKDPDVYNDMTLAYQAIRNLQAYLDIYTGARFTARATTGILVSQFVAASSSYTDLMGLVLADNTTHTKPCIGFCTQSGTVGGGCEIQTSGIWSYGNGALVPGLLYYLGTAGSITVTIPAGAGKTVQVIGWAIDTNNLLFTPSQKYVEL